VVDLIGEDTISDIIESVDWYVDNFFAPACGAVVSDMEKRKMLDHFHYDAKTDYDAWTENYLNDSGIADSDNPTHYKHCKQLFKYGVQLIERSLVASRVHLLEEAVKA